MGAENSSDGIPEWSALEEAQHNPVRYARMLPQKSVGDLTLKEERRIDRTIREVQKRAREENRYKFKMFMVGQSVVKRDIHSSIKGSEHFLANVKGSGIVKQIHKYIMNATFEILENSKREEKNDLELDCKILTETEPSEEFIANCDALTFLNSEVALHIKKLYADPGIQNTLKTMTNHFREQVEYFFADGQLDRISEFCYTPSKEDVWRLNHSLPGVRETHFSTPKAESSAFILVDVKQKNQSKLLQYFEVVNSLVFALDIAIYAKTCPETNENEMVKSLTQMESICNDSHCIKTPIIVLFKNCGALKEILKTDPITTCESFKEYVGEPDDLEDIMRYIEAVVTAMNKNERRGSYIHFEMSDTFQGNFVPQIEKYCNDIAMKEGIHQYF